MTQTSAEAETTSAAVVTMYSTVWCGYCQRLKAQLGRAGINWTEVDIEADAEAAQKVKDINGGNETVPTLVFLDGSALTNPSLKQVQAKLAELS
jgi:mycoredoxin